MFVSNLHTVHDGDFPANARVLLRLDLNVPCRDGSVYDDYRIKRSLPTLQFLAARGCRTVIISHLDADAGETLEPVFEYLKKEISVSFASSLSEAERRAKALLPGEFLLVENIRRETGEVENDNAFARRLSALGEVFVDDAFGVMHRTHASIIGVPTFLPSFAGLLVIEEVERLSPALQPKHPALFVLGGAKFETKLPLLLKFLDRYDRVLVGGALANDIFHTMGFSVGNSLVSTLAPDLSAIMGRPTLRVPLDVVVERNGSTVVVKPESLLPHDRIVDAGEKTSLLLDEFVSESNFVLWNGPLGEYQKGYVAATTALARTLSRSMSSSIIGGGDTVACIEKLGLLEKFGFVSTGGGAMLGFLAKETLPGLEALKKQ